MMPIAKANLNGFKFVKVPKIKDMFIRHGAVAPIAQSSEEVVSLEMRKNDAIDEVERLADQVPVNEPE